MLPCAIYGSYPKYLHICIDFDGEIFSPFVLKLTWYHVHLYLEIERNGLVPLFFSPFHTLLSLLLMIKTVVNYVILEWSFLLCLLVILDKTWSLAFQGAFSYTFVKLVSYKVGLKKVKSWIVPILGPYMNTILFGQLMALKTIKGRSGNHTIDTIIIHTIGCPVKFLTRIMTWKP